MQGIIAVVQPNKSPLAKNRLSGKPKNRHLLRNGLLLLLALVVVLAVLELTNVTHLVHSRNTGNSIPSTTPVGTTTKTQPTTSTGGKTGMTSTNPSNSGSTTSSTSTPSAGPAPLTPTGDFVSNHHPGGSAPTSEASTCNTSAGATCYIQFTQGSTVKKLAAQVTNGDGGTIWYWDVKNAGLTTGSWKVTAVATLNGQTKSADDALSLEVQ